MEEILLKFLLSAPFQEPKQDSLGRVVIQRPLLVRMSVLLAFIASFGGLLLMILLPDEDMGANDQIGLMVFLGISAVAWFFLISQVTFLKIILAKDRVISKSFLSRKKELMFSSIQEVRGATYFMGLNNPFLSYFGRDKASCVMSMVLIGPDSKLVIPVGNFGFEMFLNELKAKVRVKGFELIEINIDKRRKDYIERFKDK